MLESFTDMSNQMLEEAHKFYDKGNKAAGTRARVLCQQLKTKLQQIRIDIQNTKGEK